MMSSSLSYVFSLGLLPHVVHERRKVTVISVKGLVVGVSADPPVQISNVDNLDLIKVRYEERLTRGREETE